MENYQKAYSKKEVVDVASKLTGDEIAFLKYASTGKAKYFNDEYGACLSGDDTELRSFGFKAKEEPYISVGYEVAADLREKGLVDMNSGSIPLTPKGEATLGYLFSLETDNSQSLIKTFRNLPS